MAVRRYRIETVVETTADLTTTEVVEGNYSDDRYPDLLFSTMIAPYEADDDRRIISFKIWPVTDATVLKLVEKP